jgi:hypothetical protein
VPFRGRLDPGQRLLLAPHLGEKGQGVDLGDPVARRQAKRFPEAGQRLLRSVTEVVVRVAQGGVRGGVSRSLHDRRLEVSAGLEEPLSAPRAPLNVQKKDGLFVAG